MFIVFIYYIPILTRLKLTKNKNIYNMNEHETWQVVYSILPINTWTWGMQRFFGPWNQATASKTYMGLNSPSWTISTLIVWYAIFPFVLSRMQKLLDHNISYGIVRLFWISLGVVLIVGFKCYWPVKQVHGYKMNSIDISIVSRYVYIL